MLKVLLHALVFELVSILSMLTLLWSIGDLDAEKMFYLGATFHAFFFSLPLFAMLIEGRSEENSELTVSACRMIGGGATSGLALTLVLATVNRMSISISDWLVPVGAGVFVASLAVHIYLFFCFSTPRIKREASNGSGVFDE